jgi:hypothetical protein
MKSVRLRSSAVALVVGVLCSPLSADSWGTRPVPHDVIFHSLEAEMNRSLARLRQDSFGPPYFLAYRLLDVRHYELSASLGAFIGDDLEDYRVAYVEARYGDRSFDNTDLSYQGVNSMIAADPDALRQAFWSMTDQAYKGAVSGWLEKKAKRSTELVSDRIDDFSLETPQRKISATALPSLHRAYLRSLVQRLSRVFRDYPAAYESNVSLETWWSRRFYVNSEGARLLTPESVHGI